MTFLEVSGKILSGIYFFDCRINLQKRNPVKKFKSDDETMSNCMFITNKVGNMQLII